MTDADEKKKAPETVLAFRVWRWHEPTATLSSLNAGPMPKRNPAMRHYLAAPEGAWPPKNEENGSPRPLVAKCLSKDHPAPDKGCSCGIYAATNLDVIAGYLSSEAPILGLVQGFGNTVIPAEWGWRAERVQVAALLEVAPEFTVSRRQLEKIGDRYGVPVVVPHSVDVEDYRHGVRSGFAPGWELDFEAEGPDAA
jgi:hypothetical protein